MIGTESFRRRLRAFAGCARGGIALWTGVLLPAVALVAIGASELSVVSADTTRLQDVADMAALGGARELGLGENGEVADRAEAHALSQLADVAARARLTVAASVLEDGKALKLQITSNRTSFFGNLLPPGGFTTSATATAEAMSRTPLCVLATHKTDGAVVQLRMSSKVLARGCLVHANDDMKVDPNGKLSAFSAHAVGTATGPIDPAARIGAEVFEDPFAGRALAIPACPGPPEAIHYASGSHTLPAGVHCGAYIVERDATLTLSPGAHYFVGKGPVLGSGLLNVKNDATLKGEDVVLYFDRSSRLLVMDRAKLDLKGRRTGADAGMLVVAARDNANVFAFASNSVDRLEGVIYLPAAWLYVQGTGQIAEQSNWTISVSRGLFVNGSPTLVINANYAGSDVPVPVGVGPSADTGGGASRLAF